MRDVLLERGSLVIAALVTVLSGRVALAATGSAEEPTAAVAEPDGRASTPTKPRRQEQPRRPLRGEGSNTAASPARPKKRPTPRETGRAARLPAHSRDDTGKVAAIGLHGSPTIPAPHATTAADERIVTPITPAPAAEVEPPHESIEPPRFEDKPPQADQSQTPAPASTDESPALPAPAEQAAPVLPAPAPPEPAEKAGPASPVPASPEPGEKAGPALPVPAPPAPGEKAAPALPVPARAPSPPADPPAEPSPAETPEPEARPEPGRGESKDPQPGALAQAKQAPPDPPPPLPSRPSPAATGKPASPPTTAPADPDPAMPDVDVLSSIRKEIKQRLPYFQACAMSARRRNGVEVRRLQVTWAIGPDGAIKEMKLDGVVDPQLATCIVRVGNRPFSVQPGADLVVPTPIVFVR